MLVRLQPDQVARYWDFFKPAMEATLPPIAGETEYKMSNILEAFLVEALIMWISVKSRDEADANMGVEVTGFLATQVISDEMTKTKALLMYTIYTTEHFTMKEYEEGFIALSKFGKSKGCDRLTGYTQSEAIIKRAQQFGGDTSYHFISVPL